MVSHLVRLHLNAKTHIRILGIHFQLLKQAAEDWVGMSIKNDEACVHWKFFTLRARSNFHGMGMTTKTCIRLKKANVMLSLEHPCSGQARDTATDDRHFHRCLPRKRSGTPRKSQTKPTLAIIRSK